MIFHDIWLDVQAVKERDPAARNSLEVLLLYQGVHALIFHKLQENGHLSKFIRGHNLAMAF